LLFVAHFFFTAFFLFCFFEFWGVFFFFEVGLVRESVASAGFSDGGGNVIFGYGLAVAGVIAFFTRGFGVGAFA